MKTKSIIILSSVAALCTMGLMASQHIDWSVNYSDASGDIAKSERFSLRQSVEKLTNIEELIQNDSAYKDGIVTAYVEVLNDMNEARKTVTNVNNALTQNIINASLAYTTLQRQNKLANHFIEITDKYLETAEGDDRLKFVRDQWVDYQTQSCNLSQELNISTRLTSVIPPEKMNAMADEILKDVSAMQKEGNDLVMAINTMYNASEVMRPTIISPIIFRMSSSKTKLRFIVCLVS